MARRNNIKKALEEMNKKDIYSLLFFALYNLKDVPEYRLLSELSFLLDGESLFNFLNYYEGMTIKIPPKKDFKLIILSLLLYQYVELEDIPLDKAMTMIDKDNFKDSEIKDSYYKLRETLEKYNFNKGE